MKVTPLRLLRSWWSYARLVAEAVKRVEPRARVYLVGGAAENRLTVLSDIDVLVLLPYEPGFREAVELRHRVLEEAERLGLPPYAPIQLHIAGPATAARYRGPRIELEGG